MLVKMFSRLDYKSLSVIMNEWDMHWSKGAGTLESEAELKAP